MAAVLHPVEELGSAGAGDAAVFHAAHLEPGGIEGLAHFGGDLAAHRVRVLARPFQAGIDRRGVLLVERHELDERRQRELLVAPEVGVLGTGDRQGREQVLLPHVGGAEQDQVRGHAEDARGILGALHLAAHPEYAVGDA